MAITSLIRVIDHNVGPPADAFSIKPVPRKTGYMKIRLTYLTDEPKHYRSYQLATMYAFKGPFTEEIYALIPQKRITNLDLISFFPVFSCLQSEGILSRTAKLVRCVLMDEDNFTLAYPVKL